MIVVLLVRIGGSFAISHRNKQVAKNKIVLVVSKNKNWKNRYDQIKVGEASKNGKGNPAITYFFKDDKLFGKYGPEVK